MDCRKVKRLLLSFLEGELAGVCKEKIEAHLKVCAACQKEKALFLESWQMLDNYTAPKLREDFISSLMRKIHLEQSEVIKVKYRLPLFAFRHLSPVLASLFILVLAISLFWKKDTGVEKLAKITPSETQEIPTVAISSIDPDKEIIENLQVYENMEFLENLNFLTELDVVENLENSVL